MTQIDATFVAAVLDTVFNRPIRNDQVPFFAAASPRSSGRAAFIGEVHKEMRGTWISMSNARRTSIARA
jgi:hypothetical protein